MVSPWERLALLFEESLDSFQCSGVNLLLDPGPRDDLVVEEEIILTAPHAVCGLGRLRDA